MLMHGQKHVSPQRGLPVDDKGNSSTIVSVSAETIQLYYNNAGVYAIDAGQAAGVAVTGKLAYNNIKNADGSMDGSYRDTSLSFTSGALITEVEVDLSTIESVDDQTFANRLAAITAKMSNGDYCVDYASGIIYGLKTTTAVTLVAGAYKVTSGVAASVAGVASSVEASGDVAHDAVDSGKPVKIGAVARSSDPTAVAEDDRVNIIADLYGKPLSATHVYATKSGRTEEIDPLPQQFVNESLADLTNVAAETHNYPGALGLSMDGFKDLSLSGKLIDADGTLTLTVWVTNDEDRTNADWVQVYGYDDKNNVTVNLLTVTNGTLIFGISFNNMNYRYVRVAVVASGSSNTVIVKLRRKAL